jgi:N-succinyldiaminopimelate aminotransferase
VPHVNPRLSLLQPYPFERLRELFAGHSPPSALPPINLSIGEPRHPTPSLIVAALAESSAALSNYPTTAGPIALREAIARWLAMRHRLESIDPVSQVLPVLGSREALFAFAQTVVDASRPAPVVVMPNPFYQIYEGAALLAGAEAHCVNADAARGFAHAWDAVPDSVWQRTQLLYVCSPDNPTGRAVDQATWQRLFALADRHDFVIASDECYSEIYFDEARAPLGALAAAQACGRSDYARLVVFGSLSKRSNAPGLRSGFAAGDAKLLRAYLRYRTYHGSAMSGTVAHASIAAWNDEGHVRANRALYAAKFAALQPQLAKVLPCTMPDAAFYLWADVGGDDIDFARALHATQNVAVLPGSFLGRDAHGVNPGRGRVRIALVATPDECAEGIRRLLAFAARRD